MSRILLASACALAAIAPATGAAAAQRAGLIDARTRNMAGCYELVTGRWTAGADTMAIPAHQPPARFRLDSLPRDKFPSDYHRVEPSSGSTLLNIDAWRWTDSSRLVITWSANTVEGVRMDVRVSADSLIGSAASFNETVTYDRPFATASAVARRVACGRSGHDRGTSGARAGTREHERGFP